MKAALIFGIAAVAALGGWGWKATQAKHTAPPQPKTAEPLGELCVSPGSRASLLLAQPSTIANPDPLTEADIGKALSGKIIGPDLALEEVRVFNESRVPEMPRVRTAAEWKTKAAEYRKNILDKVIFRGSAAKWRNTRLKVEWGETIENLPGYRIKKLKFEAVPGWWIPALLYEPLNLKGKLPVVMNVNGHARTGKATDY